MFFALPFVATLAGKGHSNVFFHKLQKILKHKLSCSTKFYFAVMRIQKLSKACFF